MASPCIIKFRLSEADEFKQYSYEEFATMLHDGKLNDLLELNNIKLDNIEDFNNAPEPETVSSLTEKYKNAKAVAQKFTEKAIKQLTKAIKADVIFDQKEWDKAVADIKAKGAAFQAQILAWHGSPYLFDRFSTSKMGTGEGAQAFGWGLYFTDLRSIAESYAYIISLSKREKNRNVYKVSIHKGKQPSEYTWLEWDKRLSDKLAWNIAKNILSEYIDTDTGFNAIKTFREDFSKGMNIIQSERYFNDLGITDYAVQNILKGLIDGDAKSVYTSLSNFLGGDKKASLFLLENGIDGVKYPAESISRGATSDSARGFNYVVFDENAVQIEEAIQFQQQEQGIENASGFVYKGKVYLNPNKITKDTAIHEFAHVWMNHIKDTNKALYNKGLELIKDSIIHQRIQNNPAYASKGETEILEEALVQAIGEAGVGKLENLFSDKSKVQQFKEWLSKVKDFLANTFFKDYKKDIDNLTLEQFLDSTLGDLLGGKDLGIKPENQKQEILMQIVGQNAQLAQDIRDNLEVAREMESAGETPKEVKLATGWERGKDGKWRYETLDDYKLRTSNINNKNFFDVIDNKELKRMYPSISSIVFKVVPFDDVDFDANFNPNTNTIEVSSYLVDEESEGELLSVIAHEIQHKIQMEEGWKPMSRQSAREVSSGISDVGLSSPYSDISDNSIELLDDVLEQFQDNYRTLGDFLDNSSNVNMLKLLKYFFERKFKTSVPRNLKSIKSYTVNGKTFSVYDDILSTKENLIESIEKRKKDILNANDLSSRESAIKELKTLDKDSDRADDIKQTIRVIDNIDNVISEVKKGNYTVEEIPAKIKTQVKYLTKTFPKEIGTDAIAESIKDYIDENKLSEFDAYWKSQSEVEARNVQKRMNMTSEQRRNTLLEETEDVARDEQITVFSEPQMQVQMASVKLRYDSNGKHLAPNGKPSNLTEEQAKIVRTKAFKDWFGDWENRPESASKVVDENGEPLVVYHGSIASDITEFDRSKSKRIPSWVRENGTYFTTNRELADFYRKNSKLREEHLNEINEKKKALTEKLYDARSTAEFNRISQEINNLESLKEGKVYEAFLNLRDVKEFNAKGKENVEAWDNLEVKASYKWAKNRDALEFLKDGLFGVDKVQGIKAKNIVDAFVQGNEELREKLIGDVYLVFDGVDNAIKSASGNTTFDSSNRIDMQVQPQLVESVKEDLENDVKVKDIREALKANGLTSQEVDETIKYAKAAIATDELVRIAGDINSGISRASALTQDNLIDFIAQLKGQTKELQVVLKTIASIPNLTKSQINKLTALSNLEKLGKLGASDLVSLIEEVNQSSERRGKNEDLKKIFKKILQNKDVLGGKGSSVVLASRLNPASLSEEQLNKLTEAFSVLAESGKNVNQNEYNKAKEVASKILQDINLLKKEEVDLIDSTLDRLEEILSEDYDFDSFSEAMQKIYSAPLEGTIADIINSKERLKSAFKYFKQVAFEKQREEAKETSSAEKMANKLDELVSARAVVKGKIKALKGKVLQTLKEYGAGELELEDIDKILNISEETFNRLSTRELTQISNILDNAADGFYSGISGTLVAKIGGLDTVVRIEKASTKIRSIIDRTKLDLMKMFSEEREKVKEQIEKGRKVAADLEANVRDSFIKKGGLGNKTIIGMTNLFDARTREIIRPFIDSISAAMSKASTKSVEISKNFVEEIVKAKNAWDKKLFDAKFRAKVKSEYGFDPYSASPDLIILLYTTERQHLANPDDRTSYPARDIMSIRGLAGSINSDEDITGGNSHLDELKKAFIKEDGSLDEAKAKRFLNEYGFEKSVMEAFGLLNKTKELAVLANMRNHGAATDIKEEYSPRGQQNYTDVESAVQEITNSGQSAIKVNSPNLNERTATRGYNVEWNYQRLITNYVEGLTAELYLKPIIRETQFAINELKQLGNEEAQTLAYVADEAIDTLKTKSSSNEFAMAHPTLNRILQTYKLNVMSARTKYLSETFTSVLGQVVANIKDISRGAQVWFDIKNEKVDGKKLDNRSEMLSRLMTIARGSTNSAAIFALQERQIENREQVKTSISGTVKSPEARSLVQIITDALKTNRVTSYIRDRAIEKNVKLQQDLDKIPRGVGWMGAFDRKFEQLTGEKFDYSRAYDPVYITENRNAISTAQSHADVRVRKIVGTGYMPEASKEYKRRPPYTKDFQLWSLITSEEQRDSVKKIARGLSGKSEEDILQEVGDIAGYYTQSITNRVTKALLRQFFYSFAFVFTKSFLGGDDDDDESEVANKMADRLTSPEFYISATLLATKDIIMGGRNPIWKFSADLFLSTMFEAYSYFNYDPKSKEEEELKKKSMDTDMIFSELTYQQDILRAYGIVGGLGADLKNITGMIIAYASTGKDEKDIAYQKEKMRESITENFANSQAILDKLDELDQKRLDIERKLNEKGYYTKEEKKNAELALKVATTTVGTLSQWAFALTGIPHFQEWNQTISAIKDEKVKDSIDKMITLNDRIQKEFYGDDYNKYIKSSKIVDSKVYSLKTHLKAAKELKDLNEKYSSQEQILRYLMISEKVFDEVYPQQKKANWYN